MGQLAEQRLHGHVLRGHRTRGNRRVRSSYFKTHGCSPADTRWRLTTALVLEQGGCAWSRRRPPDLNTAFSSARPEREPAWGVGVQHSPSQQRWDLRRLRAGRRGAGQPVGYRHEGAELICLLGSVRYLLLHSGCPCATQRRCTQPGDARTTHSERRQFQTSCSLRRVIALEFR